MHEIGKAEVSFSIVEEDNNETRWNQCRFVGYTPIAIADQDRKRK